MFEELEQIHSSWLGIVWQKIDGQQAKSTGYVANARNSTHQSIKFFFFFFD